MKQIRKHQIINIILFSFALALFSCDSAAVEETYTIPLPDVEFKDGKKTTEYSDMGYFESKIWYVKFKRTEQIKLADGQIFYANEIWYAKEREKLLRLVNSESGSILTLPNENVPRVIKEVVFKEDKTIHYAFISGVENYYKIYLDNGDTIFAAKVVRNDNSNPTLRNEYQISEISSIISGETYWIPYPSGSGQQIAATKIYFSAGVLVSLYSVSGTNFALPGGTPAKIDAISFYPSGKIKRVNLQQTPLQSIPIIVSGNSVNATKYIEYNEDETAKSYE